MAQAIQPWTAGLPAQVRAVSQLLFAAASPLSLCLCLWQVTELALNWL